MGHKPSRIPQLNRIIIMIYAILSRKGSLELMKKFFNRKVPDRVDSC